MNKDRTFERIETLFDIELFADVKVFVAGCGSGGASVALQLVMSGIRNFTLMDRDVLGPENVIRHVCGRSFIGRKKPMPSPKSCGTEIPMRESRLSKRTS